MRGGSSRPAMKRRGEKIELDQSNSAFRCKIQPEGMWSGLIRRDCLHPGSGPRSLISCSLEEIPFCFFPRCPFKGTALFQLLHHSEWGKKGGEPSAIFSGLHSTLSADL